MAKDDSGLGSCVVMTVGGQGSGLAQTTRQWAREREIDMVPCHNVYAAVATLPRIAGRSLLIVGEMEELAREDGAFFRLAAARAARCCGLLDRSRPTGRTGLRAALDAGATVVGDVRDVRGVLQDWLAAAESHLVPRLAGNAAHAGGRTPASAGPADEDLRATAEELRHKPEGR
jgi:hypothetical protein